MKILVTGGAGYIGSICVEQLLDAGHTITYQRTKPVMESFGVAAQAAPGADAGPGGVITNTVVVAGDSPNPALGQVITSTSGEASLSDSGVPVESSITVTGGSQVISSTAPLTGSLTTVSGGQPSPFTVYTWEADGYFYILTATNKSLTQADLKAMLH